MKPEVMTPQMLFDYVDRFATRAEKRDEGTQYPTFRQIQKRFHVSYDAIEDAVADGQGIGQYFGVAIGVQIRGFGYAQSEHRGEYQVEAEP